MELSGLFDRLTGRHHDPERPVLPAVPTSADLLAALEAVGTMVSHGAVPGPVASRVSRVCRTVRETIPRLSNLGAGSLQAYNVMATATDYLPEAIGGYLRLPRQFADNRPVDHGKTSLMILVAQLDLLAATMDKVFDAVCRADAEALVAHGRFLSEKFGTTSSGGALSLGPQVAMAPDPAAAPDVPGRLQPPNGKGGL
jgi:hypothetical protein